MTSAVDAVVLNNRRTQGNRHERSAVFFWKYSFGATCYNDNQCTKLNLFYIKLRFVQIYHFQQMFVLLRAFV
jgi:hypothetical protein